MKLPVVPIVVSSVSAVKADRHIGVGIVIVRHITQAVGSQLFQGLAGVRVIVAPSQEIPVMSAGLSLCQR